MHLNKNNLIFGVILIFSLAVVSFAYAQTTVNKDFNFSDTNYIYSLQGLSIGTSTTNSNSITFSDGTIFNQNNAAAAWTTDSTGIHYNSGNVGIGVTDPNSKLDVNGAIYGTIFYDKNNTSYYVNPTGSSNFGGLINFGAGHSNSGGTQMGSDTDPSQGIQWEFDTDKWFFYGREDSGSSESNELVLRIADNSTDRFLIEGESGTNVTNIADFSLSNNIRFYRRLDMNSNKITSLAGPTSDSDAANKSYVDSTVSGGTTSNAESCDADGVCEFNALSDGASRSSSFLSGSADLAMNGWIYTDGILHTGETGSGPAGVVFGSGNTIGNDQISLITGGATRMYINNSGNVGINDSSPSDKLDVNGNVRANTYYDKNNASYYVNPSGNSNIERLNVSRFDKANVNEYDYSWGGSDDTSWYRVATLKSDSTSGYRGTSGEIFVWDHNSNYGSNIPKSYYRGKFRVQYSSNGNARDNADIDINQGADNSIRMVKVATRHYELQVRQPDSWHDMGAILRIYDDNGDATVIEDSPTATSAGSVLSYGTIDNYHGSGSFRGNINMNSNKITNLAGPSASSDAATKSYVDSASVSTADSCNGDSYCEVTRLDFSNQEMPTGSGGRVYFDENFYPSGEAGAGVFSGDGGGLAVYNQDGWGAIYTTANDQWATPQFDNLDLNNNSQISVGAGPRIDFGNIGSGNENDDLGIVATGNGELNFRAGGAIDSDSAINMSGNSLNQVSQLNFNSGENIQDGTNMRFTSNSGYLDLRPSDGSHGIILRQYDGGGTAWSGIRSETNGEMSLRADGASYSQVTLEDSGEVGIGTSNPSSKLDVNGNIEFSGMNSNIYMNSFQIYNGGSFYAQTYYDADNSSYYINPSSSGVSAQLNGDIEIGNGGACIDSDGSCSAPANGGLRLGAYGIDTSDDATSISFNGEDITNVDKLDANTVDPVYTINGNKYATYMAGMVGIKEETTGVISLDKFTEENNLNSYTIDFTDLKEGSDLWLFAEAINMGNRAHITENGKVYKTTAKELFNNFSVLLTSGFNGDVWYEKNSEDKTITIYTDLNNSDIKGEISYRFTAPRFDWKKWSNEADTDSEGLNLDKRLQ